MTTAVRTVTDVALVSVLRNGPLSTREISGQIHRHICECWAAEQLVEIEWFTDAEPVGARLLASYWGRELGFRWQPWEILPRLRRLERAGDIARIQIPGRRPMLWRLAATPMTQEVS